MKIAFLNIYNGIVNRGAERSTHELACRLAKNHKICLIQGGKPNYKVNHKIHTIPVFFPKHKETSDSFFRKFYLDFWSLQILFFTILALPLLWRENFTIVIPVNGGWQTAICKIITWIKKTKMVIIGRAGIGRDDAWNLFWKPDVFIALTSVAKFWAKRRDSRLRIVYIPNGVDLVNFQPQGEVAKIPLKKPLIICVAALESYKRIDLTIKAITKLKQASLLILGSGSFEKELRDLGERLLGKARFLLERVSFSKIPIYYRAADVFTLVSRTGEAFGNVYLEAMACNLPVVATDDESRREIIGEGGILVDPENIASYGEALKKVIESNFGNKPRTQAEKFSWDKIILEYEELFIKLNKS